MTALFAGAAVYRILVGCQPFSGMGNHHGQKAAYGGDYEAQRHWMEITWNLPGGIGSWYWYDLQYWGLDYPPLTAYVSYLCGALSHYLVGPHSVALDSSRGYEGHKSFMRATVLVTDLTIYGTAVWAWIQRRQRRQGRLDNNFDAAISTVAAFALPMLHPAIVLIDHGHFQYNTTALGLSLWSFYYLTNHSNDGHKPSSLSSDTDRSYYMAAVLFCLALNFKQMTLYYAPAVFAYLLGDCCGRSTVRRAGQQFVTLGAVVLTVFTLLWLPFVWYGPDGTSYMERLLHVLRRIFPLNRGLFEGKVANIWCALSVRPVKIRDRIPAPFQPLAALILTLVAILPSCIRLFQLGYQMQQQSQQQKKNKISFNSFSQHRPPTSSSSSVLLWGMTSCALSFFLASFQVHEKSLLMALAPASLLLVEQHDTTPFLRWLVLFGTWTLWPLLTVDRLQTAYWCTMTIFIVALALKDQALVLQLLSNGNGNGTGDPLVSSHNQTDGLFWKISRVGFYLLAGLLHGLEVVVRLPNNLPDLFPVLWSVVGCAGLSVAYLYTIWQLYYCYSTTTTTPRQQPPPQQSKAKSQ
jgi:alpha-1,3-glucosyltransferase